MSTRRKIFITGGHLTPALSAIDEIQRRHADWEILFIGRKTAMEGVKGSAYEEKIVGSYGIRFLPISAGRFQRAFTVHSILSLLKVPLGFVQAFNYCRKERPACVLSFGGYVALPVVVSAAIFHIPIVTHEQTSVPGLANKIIALFAKKICVTFEETLGLFPADKVVFTGLPVRKTLFQSAEPAFSVPAKKYPVLYITGGSTGSVSLNSILFPLIPKLVKQFTVIHQTGALSSAGAFRANELLSKAEQVHYIARDYFDMNDVSWILHHAELVIGRSGANTVMELAMLGKVAIFIPLPWSGGGEQIKNAQWLEKLGSAQVVFQEESSPEKIMHKIEEMMRDKESYMDKAKKISSEIPRDGAKRLIDQLASVIQ